ncbi:hypothetical protein GIB67_025020 [Kingdonia uniflora]|uniref:COP1-interacting protein 7 n=1 Tax=Kingdonia uniflora TaxID=39325 RepID=A0A7J7N7Q1_9MAGN|nr:hypothetical protein GIB67_025020 [Kingdonia uniflora]
MDSSTRLDYALFQLTPTRTRCDLLVSSGGKNEKLASGFLQPFISHLQSAKDQISKGGYSITLRAPKKDSLWFTKGTLERFVRFVSTPEVLERFVTIEMEILQIESSFQSSEVSGKAIEEGAATAVDGNAKKSIVLYKPTVESNGTVPEDNSKQRLQKVLEARKGVLRKEQAMAYARAFVAGYEMVYIDNLISFADAFEASRLREACINFKELCNQKHNDGLWMDELAAVEALPQLELPYLGSSGIVLTTENSTPSQSILQSFQDSGRNGSINASVSDSATGQIPPTNANMSWPNQLPPHFMYNFQNAGSQQLPPYQGYPFPGMHFAPPYYQGNAQWSPNNEEYGNGHNEPDHRRNRKSSSKKKEKSPKIQESDSEHDGHTDPLESISGSDSDDKKSSREQPRKRKNGKNSSRTVVIRNINYITSNRKDGKEGTSGESSSDEDDLINGDSIKQKVEDAVGSLEKHHRSTSRRSRKSGPKNSNFAIESNGLVDQVVESEAVANKSEAGKIDESWGAFQNLLMRDDNTQDILDVSDEYLTIKSSESGLPSAVGRSVNLECEEGTKKRLVALATDSFVVSGRNASNEGSMHLQTFEGSENFRPSMKRIDCTDDALLLSQRTEALDRNDMSSLSDIPVLKTQKGDDWFMINEPEKVTGSMFDGDHGSAFQGDYLQAEKSKTDILFDDSIMVQARSIDDDQRDNSQWRTDISMVSGIALASEHENGFSDLSGDKLRASSSYEPDDLYMMLDRESRSESIATLWTPEIDYGIDSSFKEFDKMNSGIETHGCVDDNPPKNDKFDGKSIEGKLSGKDARSKTLRGSLGKSKSEIISRNKKASTVNRTVVQKSKFEKEEENRKKMEEIMIQRQKRIAERSVARGFTSKTSLSPKDDKQAPRSIAKDTKRSSLQKPVISSSTIDRLAYGHSKLKGPPSLPVKPVQPKKSSPKVNGIAPATSVLKVAKEESKTSNSNLLKSSNQLNGAHSLLSDLKGIDDSEPKLRTEVADKRAVENFNTLVDKSFKGGPVVRGDSSVLLSSHANGFITETTVDSSSPMHNEGFSSHAVNIEDKISVKTNEIFPVINEIIEEEIPTYKIISTPPSAIGLSPESTHSRKKWTSDDTSPSSAKGLKKLLLFGRKKPQLSS